MDESAWLSSDDPAAMLRLAAGRVSLCCGCVWCNNGDGTWSLADGQECCPLCNNDTPAAGYRQISSGRKLRLFACALARRGWDHLDARGQSAVYASELFADGIVDYRQLGRHRNSSADAMEDSSIKYPARMWSARAHSVTSGHDFSAAGEAARWEYPPLPEHANLLRDIVGNPFRPVLLTWQCSCPNTRCAGCGVQVCPWLTPVAVSLAQAAYEHRDPATGHLDPVRLAVLADALEEAGCDSNQLLMHLRQPPHRHGPQCRDKDGLWCAWEERGAHVWGCWALDLVLGRGD